MCRDDGGGIDAFIRNAPCAFNYIIYSIFVQCYVMGRFGHEMLDVSWGRFSLVFSFIGAVLVGAVLVCVGRFRPSLGPFWRWAVLVGSLLSKSPTTCSQQSNALSWSEAARSEVVGDNVRRKTSTMTMMILIIRMMTITI